MEITIDSVKYELTEGKRHNFTVHLPEKYNLPDSWPCVKTIENSFKDKEGVQYHGFTYSCIVINGKWYEYKPVD